MNISSLENIKIVENDHQLKILVLNDHLKIGISTLIAFSNFGDTVVAVSTPIEMSTLIGKLGGIKTIHVNLMNKIPLLNYDVLITEKMDDMTNFIIENLKMKYVLFFDNSATINSKNYYRYELGAFKLTNLSPEHAAYNKIINEKKETIVENVEIDENSLENYNICIDDVYSAEMKYNKFTMNYLHVQEPGKISIIMIVSEQNDKFADTLRAIRHQHLPSIEFIIIDNGVGYRTVVKTTVKYFEKMPIDYCIYHAKELCSGEYMIILNQDSEPIDVMEAINSGKYETR